MTDPNGPYIAMATYLVRPDKVEEFHGLMARHWPTLREEGLATDRPAEVYFGEDKDGPFFVEFVEWVDSEAPGRAFRNDRVSAIWQDLFAFTESRGGRPAVDYPKVVRQHYERFARQPQG